MGEAGVTSTEDAPDIMSSGHASIYNLLQCRGPSKSATLKGRIVKMLSWDIVLSMQQSTNILQTTQKTAKFQSGKGVGLRCISTETCSKSSANLQDPLPHCRWHMLLHCSQGRNFLSHLRVTCNQHCNRMAHAEAFRPSLHHIKPGKARCKRRQPEPYQAHISSYC